MIPPALPSNSRKWLDDGVQNDGIYEEKRYITREDLWKHPFMGYIMIVMVLISFITVDFQSVVLLTFVFIMIPSICIEIYAVIATLFRKFKNKTGYITKENLPQHLLIEYVMITYTIIFILFYSDMRTFLIFNIIFILVPFVAFAVVFQHKRKRYETGA